MPDPRSTSKYWLATLLEAVDQCIASLPPKALALCAKARTRNADDGWVSADFQSLYTPISLIVGSFVAEFM